MQKSVVVRHRESSRSTIALLQVVYVVWASIAVLTSTASCVNLHSLSLRSTSCLSVPSRCSWHVCGGGGKVTVLYFFSFLFFSWRRLRSRTKKKKSKSRPSLISNIKKGGYRDGKLLPPPPTLPFLYAAVSSFRSCVIFSPLVVRDAFEARETPSIWSCFTWWTKASENTRNLTMI